MKGIDGVKRFGILTAGGDCPGLNAAIRGVCRAAVDQYGMTAVGIANGYKGLIDGDLRVLEPRDFSGILTQGGTILGTSREKPFKSSPAFTESDMAADKIDAVKRNYKKHDLDGLVVLGGNGTNTTGYLLAQEGLNIIGLPKTIDNDIVGTDMTFGFYSAQSIGTETIDRLHSTAASHNRVMIIELMGHKSGWLTLYAGVAGGGDIILIPEIPYDLNEICRHLEERQKSGKAFSIVVAAEGALSAEEARMEKKDRKKKLAESPSIAYRLAHGIEEKTGMSARATVLGYVQRGGIPTPPDRILATNFGTYAAGMLHRGEFGRMVALDGYDVTSVDLSVPAHKSKAVPLNHPLLDAAFEIGTCLGSPELVKRALLA